MFLCADRSVSLVTILMVNIDYTEAEDILEQGEDVLESRQRPNENTATLEEKVEELRQALEEDSDDVPEKAKELVDFMEQINENSVHDEPEMTPESEREGRERGPREDEYAPDKTDKTNKTG